MLSFFRILLLCAAALNCPLIAANIFVKAGDSLQAALNVALPGDVITLEAGATFTGNFVLPNKSGTGTIRIESSALSSLPERRITPADKAQMPKLVSIKNSPTITAAAGAHDYVLSGLEITVPPDVYSLGIVQLGLGTETTLEALPNNITIDRCFIHGDAKAGSKRGVATNSRKTIVRRSWISDIKSTFQDSQAVGGFNGPGPFEITDNQLEATGENIMFGGAIPSLRNVVPSDIVIRGNTLFKPLTWRYGTPASDGVNWFVKNHFELKNARRVVFDGNILENCWASAQNGSSILLTVRDENGRAPWVVVEDVVISNNIIRHAGVGITAHEKDTIGGTTRNIAIRNNLFEDIDMPKWGGTGTFMLLSGRVPGVVIEHNTLLSSRFGVYFGYGVSPGVIFRNNVMNQGLCADNLACSYKVITALGASAIVAGNVFVGQNAVNFPTGNFYPADLDAVRFADPATSNYALARDSFYRNVGTDGKDPGVDMVALQRAINGGAAPEPDPEPVRSTATVSVTPATAAVWGGRSTTLKATVAGTTDTAVRWTMNPAIGSLTQGGVYTAPATIAVTQVVQVTATLIADPTKSATASLTLVPIGISLSTTARSLMYGQSITLWPSVSGTYDTRVQWSAPAIGSMDTATTAQTTYSYLKSPTGTQSNVMTLTAKSMADPAKTASAVITLVPPRVKITLSDSTTIRPGQFRYVTAGVYDIGDPAYRGVTWKMSPSVGVLDTVKGTYTPPAGFTTAVDVQLTATSVVDPRQSHTITLNLRP